MWTWFVGALFVWLFVLSVLRWFDSQNQKRLSEQVDVVGRAWKAVERQVRERPGRLDEQEQRIDEKMVGIGRLVGALDAVAGRVYQTTANPGTRRDDDNTESRAFCDAGDAHPDESTAITYPYTLCERCGASRTDGCPGVFIEELCAELWTAKCVPANRPAFLGEG